MKTLNSQALPQALPTPTLTITSGKPSPHTGYITATATLYIPASNLTLISRTNGYGYNQPATVLLDLMNQLSCPNDGLHHNTDDMKTTLLNWISQGNIRPRPILPVLFKHVTYSKHSIYKTYEVLALFPTLPANYGSILCYSYIGQHSECDYGFAIGNGEARLRKATITEYTPLLIELKSIYESEPDAYRLEVKSQLKHADLVAMWNATRRK